MRAILTPHPSTPDGPVESIEVLVGKAGRRRLWARYFVSGDVERVRWPQPRPGGGGRADGLWRTTCFEAFLWAGGRYWEYNFSPAGEWAAYRFDGYRQGQTAAAETASPALLELGAGGAELEAGFERPDGVIRIGLSAVIEDAEGSLSYWALAHPSDKPDFHHPDSFILDAP